MEEQGIQEHLRKAVVEAIASRTVGIGVLNNTGIGTGTLIGHRGKRYVLTAEHVITGAAIETMRFWFRPPRAMIDKAAKDASPAELGKGTVGDLVPIVAHSTSDVADLALLEIDPRFELPPGTEVYDLSMSASFGAWQLQAIDGLSLFVFGFPIENSRTISKIGNKERRYLGTAWFQSQYREEINAPDKWSSITSKFDASKDFLFEYNAPDYGVMHPGGFSGGGVWAVSEAPGRPVWTSEPVLLGVVLRYFKRRGLLAAAQVPAVFSVLRDHAH